MSKRHKPAVLEARSNPENPATPLSNPDEWVYDAFGIATSATGIKVSTSLALNISAFWRAANLIGTYVAKTPIEVMRRVDGGKERDTTHPAYYVLRRKANSEMTANTWKHLMATHAVMHGNGYSYIARRGNGDVEDLIPLDPETTYPIRENGRLFYVVTAAGDMRRLNPDQVLHFKGFSKDGLQGYSVIDKARESLGLAIAGTRHFAKFFAKGSHPSVILECPSVITKPEVRDRIISAWNSMHSGVDSHFKTALLEAGIQLKPFGFNSKDSQFLEARQFENREIANFFGVPPHKLGDPTRTAYNSLEEENQSFNDDCLDGWFCVFEEEMESKLLRDREQRGDTHVIEFKRESLLRANLMTQAAYFRAALGGRPWMSRNEVRGIMNLNSSGADGDTFLDPLNMGNTGGDDKDPKQKGATGTPDPVTDEDARHRAVLDVLRRMVRRVCTAARQAAKRPETLAEWCERGIEREHAGVIIEACDPILTLAGAFLMPEQIALRISQAVQRARMDGDFLDNLSAIESTLPADLARECIGGM